MKQRSLNLAQDDRFINLPSPKVKVSQLEGVHKWFHYYAAYSEDFALAAINELNDLKDPIIFDPFLGSGTSVVASTKLNLKCIGLELSPCSALLCRAKVAFNFNMENVFNLLGNQTIKNIKSSQLLTPWFSRNDQLYAHNVISKILNKVKIAKSELLRTLIEDTTGEYDDIIIALSALVIASRGAAKSAKGSNFIWTRPAQKGEIPKRKKLEELTKEKANQLLNDLGVFRASQNKPQAKILLGDARNIPLESNSVDIIITSPPYLNRLDYVISQQPELLILSILQEIEIDELRKEMVGTTKIVGKGEPDPCWGNTCINVLEQIRTHPSKASATYYIWNYYKYFKDIYKCFSEMKRVARPKSEGILVIQNSYYKDISIPIKEIFMEMSTNLGFEMQEVKSIDVKTHMGLLSPQQRNHTDNKKILKEKVLLMNF